MWPFSRRPQPKQVEAYWSALVRGASATELARLSEPLNLDLISTIARIRSERPDPRPDPAFVLRLESTLMNAFASPKAETDVLQPVDLAPTNGSAALRQWRDFLPALPTSKDRRRWILAQFATAVLIIFTLIAMWYVFRPEQHNVIIAPEGTPIVAPSPAPSVPMFRGNPDRTGVMPGPGLAEPPGIVWSFDVGDTIFASPIVANGIVYVGESGSTTPPNGKFFAIDARTGEERWHADTAGRVNSSAAVADGVLFVGDESGNLYAFAAATGAEQWRFALGGPAESSSPLVVNGVVYIVRVPLGVGASSPTLAGDLVIVGANSVPGTDDTILYAVDAATGQERWEYDGFARDHGGFYALDAATGQPRWSIATGSFSTNTAAVVDGVAYFSGGDDNTLYAVDASTGQERWRFSLGADASQNSPAVANGLVYLPADDGNVYAVDAVTGTERWRFQSGGRLLIFNSPAVAGDAVYFGTMSGQVFAVDAVTGRERWHVPLPTSQIHSSPAVVGGMVFIGAYDHRLYAIGDVGPGTPVAGTPAPSATS